MDEFRPEDGAFGGLPLVYTDPRELQKGTDEWDVLQAFDEHILPVLSEFDSSMGEESLVQLARLFDILYMAHGSNESFAQLLYQHLVYLQHIDSFASTRREWLMLFLAIHRDGQRMGFEAGQQQANRAFQVRLRSDAPGRYSEEHYKKLFGEDYIDPEELRDLLNPEKAA